MEGLSYKAESATSKDFSEENLQRDSNLECKFDNQFQITIQLQLPINSIPKTKRTIINIELIKTGHYQPCFFFSVMALFHP